MNNEPPWTTEFVNLDEIPSPNMEPGSPTPVVEETQQTTTVGMDIDMPEVGQSQQAKDAGNPSCPENPEEAPRVNGMVPNQTEVVAPERSHTTTPEQQQEGIVEDVTGRAEAYTEERTMEAGTLSQPPQWKGKQPVARSPRRQAATTIVLPCILEGVRIMANLLGCMEKLWYSDHDVTDMDKFPEFAKKVYLDTVGIGPFDEPIVQPKQWAAGLANTGF
jgi:hypothetical protein